MQTCRSCDAHSTDDLRYCGSCGEPLRDDAPAKQRARQSDVIPSGTQVGSYRLLEVIGEGGMGRVYLAEHVRLGRKVALKMLRSKYSQNPEAVRRFFTEARAVNRIAHENIVEVTDFVSDPEGSSYYIMELLTGQTLYDLLDKERHLPLERALSISIQVANALAAVHEAGIVHRDLKPDNIFLCVRGARSDLVKLLDFGIAKLVEPGLDISLQRTGVGTLMGTPAYMSPEQASAGPIDYRSDIYALGVILYELTTGVVPFHGASYGEILVQHLTHPPRKPSTFDDLPHPIPVELEKLILHCLTKDAGKRPQGMRQVEERLRAIHAQLVRGESIMTGPTWPSLPRVAGAASSPDLSRSTGAGDEPLPGSRARRRLVVGAGGLAVTAAIASAWFLVPGLRGGRADDPGQGARAVDRPALGPDGRTPIAASGGPAGSAPAPEPPPPPPPPPAIEPVTVTIHSTPSGAEVFRLGQVAPLGLTPFETRVDPTDEAVVFEIRKEGFAPVLQSVKLSEDVFISVGLSPAAPAASPAPARPVKPRVIVRRGKPPAAQKADEKAEQKAAPPAERERPADRRVDKSGVIDAFEQ